MSHHTRLREKNGYLHLSVRFGHRTKAANFFNLRPFITRETQRHSKEYFSLFTWRALLPWNALEDLF